MADSPPQPPLQAIEAFNTPPSCTANIPFDLNNSSYRLDSAIRMNQRPRLPSIYVLAPELTPSSSSPAREFQVVSAINGSQCKLQSIARFSQSSQEEARHSLPSMNDSWIKAKVTTASDFMPICVVSAASILQITVELENVSLAATR